MNAFDILPNQVANLWTHFVQSSPTNAEYRKILQDIPPLRVAAADALLRRPTRQDLLLVMELVPGRRHEAWTKLLALEPTADDLAFIVEYADGFLQELCARTLLAQSPSNDHLLTLITCIPAANASPALAEIRTFAARLLLSRRPTNNHLRCLLRQEETLREEAAARLLEQEPAEEDLRCIAHLVPSRRRQVGTLLEALVRRGKIIDSLRSTVL